MSFLQGFSLIELLVVVTIVGILSAVAIPAYDRYIVKTHVSGIITIADSYKVKLIEEFVTTASTTDSVYNLNTNVIDKIVVQSLNTEPAKYVVQAVAKMKTPDQVGIGLKQPKKVRQPLIIQLQGENIGELIVWSCHVAPEYNDYVPSSCKNNNLEDLRII
jgi:prepilin-type N-terminal cleavage/methylation domain-containing protein